MKTLVVYDSQYGNTEKVAKAISREAKKVGEATLEDLEKADLIIVGSPTQGGMPTQAIREFLQEVPQGKKMAVFDTRMDPSQLNWGLKLLVKTIGYAAEKMGKNAIAREGFVVEGKEGPLRAGELERAKEWARQLK